LDLSIFSFNGKRKENLLPSQCMANVCVVWLRRVACSKLPCRARTPLMASERTRPW
jgi:hypothetical protein